MAITILGDRIQIGNFTLTETGSSILGVKKFAASKINGSFTFDGVLSVASLYNTESQATVGTFSGGGIVPGNVPLGSSIPWGGIDKFPFSNISLAKTVSSLFLARGFAAAASSRTGAYTFGGTIGTPAIDVNGLGASSNIIDRFAFQNDLNAKNIGILGTSACLASGQSSSSHGYVTGGHSSLTNGSIQSKSRYPFSAEITMAETAGSLSDRVFGRTGFSSAVNGYYMSRAQTANPSYLNHMLSDPVYLGFNNTRNGKFPFANDVDNQVLPSFTGNLPTVTTGVSSPEAGYFANFCSFSADEVQQYGESLKISKFPFASEVTINFAGYLYGAHQSTTLSRFIRGYGNRGTAPVEGPGFPGSTQVTVGPLSEHNFIASTSNETMGVLGGGTRYIISPVYPSSFLAGAGVSSQPYLYSRLRRMDTFPFASDAFCTYVGDLSTGRSGMVGHSDK